MSWFTVQEYASKHGICRQYRRSAASQNVAGREVGTGAAAGRAGVGQMGTEAGRQYVPGKAMTEMEMRKREIEKAAQQLRDALIRDDWAAAHEYAETIRLIMAAVKLGDRQ